MADISFQVKEGDHCKDNLETDVVDLMKKRLPPYVVSCLVTSGYDSLDVILGMDTSENPGNSIETIERFVEKYHSEGGQISCEQNVPIKLPHPFVFPPGHRIMISNFISELKKSVKTGKKHSLNASESTKAKRERLQQSTSYSSSSDGTVEGAADISDDTICSVTNQVRRGISSWVRKQQNCFLKENQHFAVKVQKCKYSLTISAFVQCLPCGKKIQLQRDPKTPSSFMLSNWTRHMKGCRMLHKTQSNNFP